MLKQKSIVRKGIFSRLTSRPYLVLASLCCLTISATVVANTITTPILSLLFEDSECQAAELFSRDEFNCDTLSIDNSPWEFVNESSVVASIANGGLFLELAGRRLWFDDDQGVLMHRPVSGNFKATTSVRVYRTSDSNLLPQGAVQLAGLMVRDPASDMGSENYLFIVAGFDVNDISVETKTTINNVSTFEGPSWSGGEAELRICRIGTTFYLYKRLPGQSTWQVADDPMTNPVWPFVRPDLPTELQLGLNIYTSISNYDITARFEYLTVEMASTVADCTQD
ncbi:MAG: hypothetical protein ACRBHB_19720 [Arenicella sp.]